MANVDHFLSLLDEPEPQVGAQTPGLLNVDLGQDPRAQAVLRHAGREAALAGQPNQFVPQQIELPPEEKARVEAAGNPLTRFGNRFNETTRGLLGPHASERVEAVASLSPAEDVRTGLLGLKGVGEGIAEFDPGKFSKGLSDTFLAALGSIPGVGDVASAGLKVAAGFGPAVAFRKTPVPTTRRVEDFDGALKDKPEVVEEAELPSGDRLQVRFDPIPATTPDTKEYEISFTVNGGMTKGAVNPRDAMPLMATVRGVVNQFVQDFNPDKVKFSRAYPELEKPYNRTVKGLAEGFDGKATKTGSSVEEGGGFEVIFNDLAHPSRVAKRKAASPEVQDPRGLERFPAGPGNLPDAGQLPLPGGERFPAAVTDFDVADRPIVFPEQSIRQALSPGQEHERAVFSAGLLDNAGQREAIASGVNTRGIRVPAAILEDAQRRAGTDAGPQSQPRHQGTTLLPSPDTLSLRGGDIAPHPNESFPLLEFDRRLSEQVRVPDPASVRVAEAAAEGRASGERFRETQLLQHPPARGETVDEAIAREAAERGETGARPNSFADPDNPTMDEILTGIRQLIGATEAGSP